MTTVSSVTSVGSPTSAQAPASTTKTDSDANTLDYNAFLKLLVAQMKNQDPTNPTDPTTQLSQLASFSNVEQSIKLNQKLEAMTTLNALTQANNLIGRTITNGDGTASGTVKSVQVTSEGTVATLTSGGTIPLDQGVKVE